MTTRGDPVNNLTGVSGAREFVIHGMTGDVLCLTVAIGMFARNATAASI